MSRPTPRFNKEQNAALSGKIPMTKELFWGCLDVCWAKSNMEKFWEIWNTYPEYINDWHREFDRDMKDPNSDRRKEADAWWADMRPKLIEAFGENWVAEHCKE